MIQFENSSSATELDPASEQLFQELKATIHEELVEALDLSAVTTLEHEGIRNEIREVAAERCRSRTSKWSQELQDANA